MPDLFNNGIRVIPYTQIIKCQIKAPQIMSTPIQQASEQKTESEHENLTHIKQFEYVTTTM